MMDNNNKTDWSLVIRPKAKLISLDFREIWAYRDLFSLYIKRNITTRYKQTVLGPLWFIINPILSVVVYVAVFGGIVGIPTDGIPAPLFYLLGVAIWGFFSACLNETSNAFVNNSGLFGKVYFPRIMMPLISVTTCLFDFGIQLSLFVVVYIVYAVSGTLIAINWTLLLFPALLVMLAFLAMGFGMLISSMTTKYRDLQMIFAYMVSLWMYVTPVIYPLSMVNNQTLHTAMSFNPVTPIMEAIKYSLLGAGEFSWLWLGYSLICTVLLFIAGLAMFNKVQKNFMDTV